MHPCPRWPRYLQDTRCKTKKDLWNRDLTYLPETTSIYEVLRTGVHTKSNLQTRKKPGPKPPRPETTGSGRGPDRTKKQNVYPRTNNHLLQNNLQPILAPVTTLPSLPEPPTHTVHNTGLKPQLYRYPGHAAAAQLDAVARDDGWV